MGVGVAARRRQRSRRMARWITSAGESDLRGGGAGGDGVVGEDIHAFRWYCCVLSLSVVMSWKRRGEWGIGIQRRGIILGNGEGFGLGGKLGSHIVFIWYIHDTEWRNG
jgi:hypothetical protein